jgi:hypothetical protein
VSHGDADRSLEMPFVACVSQGGAYDDESFVAGFEAGVFSATLASVSTYGGVLDRWVRPHLVGQLELIAMRHGQALRTFGSDPSGEWIRIRAGHPSLVRADPR